MLKKHRLSLSDNKLNFEYNGIIITNIEMLPDFKDLEGFVYKITNLSTGNIYIGRKNFYSFTKKKLKKEFLSKDKRRKDYIIEKKESNWVNYNSSCKQLIEDIKSNKYSFKKEIIFLAKTKKQLSFWEAVYQFKYDVLLNDSYNDNILGKFFKKDV